MAQCLGKLVDLIRCAANKARDLRRVVIEVVCRAPRRFGDIADDISASLDLLIKKTLGSLVGIGSQRNGGMFCLIAGLLRDFGNLRGRLTCRGANVY